MSKKVGDIFDHEKEHNRYYEDSVNVKIDLWQSIKFGFGFGLGILLYGIFIIVFISLFFGGVSNLLI